MQRVLCGHDDLYPALVPEAVRRHSFAGTGASGTYRIETIEDRALRLIPSEAVSGTTPLIVAAMALPHEQPIESRVALSVPNGEDEHHVVQLLPDGKGLDAGGTYSGLRSRGTAIQPLPMGLLRAAFQKR